MCTVQYHEVKKVEGGRGGWEAGLRRLRRLEESTVEKDGGGAGGNFLDPFQQLLVKEQGEDGD